MGGFATYDKGGGIPGTTVYADNVDFTGTGRTNTITTNGQLLIGSTSANAGGNHINVGSLTSPLGTLTIGFSSPNITIDVAGGSSAVQHLTGNTGGQLNPTLSNFNILTANSTAVIAGATSTLTLDFNITNLLLGSSGSAITSAVQNTGMGQATLTALTSGGGNSAFGYHALTTCSTGGTNSAFGIEALSSLSSSNTNSAFGYQALKASNGDNCNAFGGGSLAANTSGTGNNSFGSAALSKKTTGNNNSAFGDSALFNLATGANNSAFGNSAGSALTTNDSNNIDIGNTGTVGDNGTIKIGTSGTHTTCFVSGIQGVSVSNALPVYINSSTGQLGTGTSSGIVTWTDVTGTTQTIAVNSGYYSDNAGTVTFTLPATATQFSRFRIVGVQGAWTIAQNANQAIRVGSSTSTTGITGSISSTNARDSVEVIAVVGGASTIWSVISSMGNITVA